MRKAIKGFFVAALVVLFNPLSAQATYQEKVNKCEFQWMDPGITWSRDEVVRTIRCFANKFGVDVSKALYVADRESHYNEWAYNDGGCGGSDCGGLFQHHMAYWSSRADYFPDWQRWLNINSDCWCNPRIQSLVTTKMVQKSGWGPWGG